MEPQEQTFNLCSYILGIVSVLCVQNTLSQITGFCHLVTFEATPLNVLVIVAIVCIYWFADYIMLRARCNSEETVPTVPPESQDSDKTGPSTPSDPVVDKDTDQHDVEKTIRLVLEHKYDNQLVLNRRGYIYLTSANDRKNKNSVIIKTYVKSQMNKEKKSNVYSELALLKRIKHNNILNLWDDLDTANDLHLVFERPKGLDLFDHITISSVYTEYDASRLFFQLCSAIEFLHSMNIVHRNIRMESIMVSYEQNYTREHLTLGDFTMASDALVPLNVSCGTLCCMAPEMLSDERYGTKVDIWAAGVVGYIMLCGYWPFGSLDKDEILRKIKSGSFEFETTAWEVISDSAKDLLALMLKEDVNIRSTATEVLGHRWLSDQDKDNNENNLQPTLRNRLFDLTLSMEFSRHSYGQLIGARHTDENNPKFQQEVCPNESVD